VFVTSTVIGGFILALCDDAGWFRKPWDKLAMIFAAAHWLIGNAWGHWTGGAIIGFAAGICIDAILQSRISASAKPLPPTEEVSIPSRRRTIVQNAGTLTDTIWDIDADTPDALFENKETGYVKGLDMKAKLRKLGD
jgi:hypothetical protein